MAAGHGRDRARCHKMVTGTPAKNHPITKLSRGFPQGVMAGDYA